MAIQERETVFEDEFKLQLTEDGTPYICPGKRFLEKAGHDPDSEDVPEELTLHYHDGGQRDGIVEIDLKPDHER